MNKDNYIITFESGLVEPHSILAFGEEDQPVQQQTIFTPTIQMQLQ